MTLVSKGLLPWANGGLLSLVFNAMMDPDTIVSSRTCFVCMHVADDEARRILTDTFLRRVHNI